MKQPLSLWSVILLVTAVAYLFVTSVPRATAADDTSKKADATFEVYKDKADNYRWRLRTQNTKVIATSGEGFSSKQSCMDAIQSVKKHAADATITEVAAPTTQTKE